MKKNIGKLILFSKNPLLIGSLIMIGGSMTANVFNYIYHLLMGKMLGPVDYGVLSSVFSLLYMISIVPLSTSVSIVKFISAAKPDEVGGVYNAINKFILRVAIVSSLIVAILSPFLAQFLHINDIRIVLLVAPVMFFSLLGLVNQATAQGQLKFLGVVVPNLSSSLVKLLLGLLFVGFGWSVFGAIWGVFLGTFFAYLSSLLFVKKMKQSKKGNFHIGPFLKYSFPALLQALAFTSLFTTDLILVKHFLPSLDAGLYAALSTLGKIIFFASSPVTAVMFPIVSGRKAKGERYFHVFLLTILLNGCISFSIVLLYTIFPHFILGLLYSKDYQSAADVLPWMGVFIGVYTLTQLLVNFLLSIGVTKVGYLPLIAALMQIGGIIIWHQSILQVVQVSLTVTIALFFVISGYVITNHKYGI